MLKVNKMHSCESTRSELEIVASKNEIKNLAESTRDGYKKIFDNFAMLEPKIASSISFHRIRNIMKKRRGKKQSEQNQ